MAKKIAARIVNGMTLAFAMACVATAYPFLSHFSWYVRLGISFVIFLVAQGFSWALVRSISKAGGGMK